MRAVKAFASAFTMRVVRWLVKGHGASFVLAGTLALAGLGAAAANPPAAGGHSVVDTLQDNNQLVWGYPYKPDNDHQGRQGDHHRWQGDHAAWDMDDGD